MIPGEIELSEVFALWKEFLGFAGCPSTISDYRMLKSYHNQ